MFFRKLIMFCLSLHLILVATFAHAQLPQISSGLSYLTSAQNQDGTWGNVASTVETTAATASVLDTLRLLNQTAGTPYINGTAWLQAQSPQSVAYIAERIRLLGLTDTTAISAAVDLAKGGWGGDVGYETNRLDTALALQALRAANYTDQTILNQALAYLTNSQNTDGGWGFVAGDPSTGSGQAVSNIYLTAIVSATLQQFPQTTVVATSVSRATSYLLAGQNQDGSFGAASATYETALALISLLGSGQVADLPLQSAVSYLTTTQAANGS